MWIRAAVLLLVATMAASCRSEPAATPHPESLRALAHLGRGPRQVGVILDAKTGRPLAAVRVNNPIRAAIPDGSGGWYIGGGFIHVNGVLRKRLAHIDADGRLDPNWKPEANGNGVSVTSLARIGSRLYIAGDFARLNHRPRIHLGAIDVQTGKLDPGWKPPQNRPFGDNVLLPAGKRLLVGGGDCCAAKHTALVALDAETGTFDSSWPARVDASALEGGGVRLLARDGSRIIVSGVVRSVDGVPQSIAAIEAKTGRLDGSWTPPPIGTKTCPWCALLALAVGDGRIYGSVNGPAKYQLLALDRTGRRDTRWRVRLGATTEFYGGASASALAVAGNRVYATGDFDRINGIRRNGFAALDAESARVLPSWQPRASTVFGSLLVPSRSRLLLGIELARALQFEAAGLKAFGSVRTLRLRLALSGPGTVRIGLGRGCNVERWTETGRCSGRVFRRLSVVGFARTSRRRYVHRLRVPGGRYFLRFVPESRDGVTQVPQDFPIMVPPTKVRSTIGG